MRDHKSHHSAEDNDRFTPTLLERIQGVFLAIAYVITGFARAIPHVFEVRDSEGLRRRQELARRAAEKVRTTPLREVEEEAGIDRYDYAGKFSGYSTHPRYNRPASRSEEERRFADAEKR